MVGTLLMVLAAVQSPTPAPAAMLTDTSLIAVSRQAHFATYAPTPLPARDAVAGDTVERRVVDHSDAYYTRLTIHRYASYATLPLVVTEYFLGQSLFNNPSQRGTVRSAHSVVAGGIGVLFGVNTITGVWNLWDSRHDTEGRTRRYVHSILMLAADGGFAWAGATAPGEHGGTTATLDARRRKHRTIAITSMGISLVGYGIMLLWTD